MITKKPIQIFANTLIVALYAFLGGCGSSNDNSNVNPIPTVNTCSADVTAGASFGITAVPASASAAHKLAYCKYIKIDAPNGKPIHIYAQNKITNEQMIRAKSIMEFYLTDVPGSTYGADKTKVKNAMANNNAILLLLNGSHVEGIHPPTIGQPLHQTENIVEGSSAYFSNNPRDAAFEEILHLVHDEGIGVDGTNGVNTIGSQSGLSAYQTEIRKAANNALPTSINPIYGTRVSPSKGLWAINNTSWLGGLNDENSFSQEYLVSVVETYYGQTRYISGRGHGISVYYAASERLGSNGIQAKDPMGWALLENNTQQLFFSKLITFEVRVDSAISKSEFSLTLNTADTNEVYTYKTQYMTKVRLLGTKNTNLKGNGYNNTLRGNAGNNIIRGEAGDDELHGGAGNDTFYGGIGSDTVVYQGNVADYTKVNNGTSRTITDNTAQRDGTDTFPSGHNIEYIQFKDAKQAFSTFFPSS